MFNYIWAVMILISVVFSFFSGTAETVTSAAAEGGIAAVEFSLELIGIMAFWNGIMNIAEKSGIIQKFAKVIKPVFRKLFKSVDPKSPAAENMLMNITANILGLGNGATPFGIKAMKELGKPAGGIATDDMIMFLVFNTASIQLIPTTVIAMRSAAGSSMPSEITVPVWIVSCAALAVGIFVARRFR